jgi:hypothetical protein
LVVWCRSVEARILQSGVEAMRRESRLIANLDDAQWAPAPARITPRTVRAVRAKRE